MKSSFKIIKVDHIGIATNNYEELNHFFQNIMSLDIISEENVVSEKVKVLKLNSGNTHIEVLKSISDDSPIEKFVKKNKTGVHHIAFLVDDLKSAILHFKNNNVRVIYDPPKEGASDKLITFLHPSDTFGVLIELSQIIEE